MRRNWKKRAGVIIVLLFISGMVIFVTSPPKRHIPILMYHFVVPKNPKAPITTTLDVSVETFEKQMRFLKTFGFRPISLDEFYAIEMSLTEAKGKQLVITFDDGNETYLQYALPILERYGFPSVNFVIWNNLAGKESGSMSLDDARKTAKNPLVTLGSHTLSHANLKDTDPETARYEIFESKRRLENVLEKPVYYLSYPTGDFSGRAAALVQEAGYRLAFTTSPKHLGVTRPETLYSRIRYKIGAKDNLFIFWLKASGLAAYGKQLRFFVQRLTAKSTNDKLEY